jgi:PEP-CTERM motif
MFFVLPLLAPALSAATVTLTAVADTSLFENKPDSNLGATTLVAGTNQQFSRARGLFRFDVSAIPAGAVITGVEVHLYVTRQPDPDQHGGPADSDFSLYRMFVGWGEGTGGNATGSVAAAGDATWNERHHAGISWGAPGGLLGTDYASVPSATTSVGNVGPYVWGSSTELIDDVRAWVETPAANFGFILVNQSEGTVGSARRFSATEQPGGLIAPPQLVVTYNAVPEPGMFALTSIGLLGLCLRRRA